MGWMMKGNPEAFFLQAVQPIAEGFFIPALQGKLPYLKYGLLANSQFILFQFIKPGHAVLIHPVKCRFQTHLPAVLVKFLQNGDLVFFRTNWFFQHNGKSPGNAIGNEGFTEIGKEIELILVDLEIIGSGMPKLA